MNTDTGGINTVWVLRYCQMQRKVRLRLLFKGTHSQIGTKNKFPSNASESTYVIIIILFDIEIEHKNTKNVIKSLCLWWGSNPRRSITH